MTMLTVSELLAARSVVGRAFADDPLMAWLFPDERVRLDATSAWLGVFVDAYVSAGYADVECDGDEIIGVALWRTPIDAQLMFPNAPTLGGLMAALLGVERAAAIGTGLRVFGASHPTEPHAYLNFLAVDPARHGEGLGSRLVRRGLERAAALGLPTHLETTNTRNVGFYRALGFEVTAEFTLAPDGPPAWTLLHPPAR
jgi:ribosomal protein S18 acetylase RimI-like enzyme